MGFALSSEKEAQQAAAEVELAGGNENVVVRVGDTVRRPVHPWTPAVQTLLRHLKAVGFTGAPRTLGIDDLGRDMLTFIPGRVGNYPLLPAMTTDAALIASARLLRAYHDAATVQPGWLDLPWHWRHPDPARWEVICQSDVAPYNVVFDGEVPRALIDFDHAGPGPRAWDVAYAAYRFAPLAADRNLGAFGFDPAIDRPGRLRTFLETYGELNTNGLIDLVIERVTGLRDDILARAAAGDPGVERHLAEDHVGSYNADLEWIRVNHPVLAAAIGQD
jgi:hypothetical protein